ncbi:MAG: glycosyltransferase [Pseudomonadales bacterium]|nr:glycosyltransferase [Pseudomonadales bacterium]
MALAPIDKPLIAHIIYRLDVGGLENGLVNIINRLPKDSYRHAIICLTDYTDFSQRIEPPVELIALHKKPGKDIGLYWRIFKTIRRLNPDILHTRNLATLESQLLAWLARVPYRIHGLHGWDVYDIKGENKRYQRLHRFIDFFVHRYIPLSNDLEEYLQHKIGVDSGKISKICNGVDTDRFYPRAPHPNLLPRGEKGQNSLSQTAQNQNPLSQTAQNQNPLSQTAQNQNPLSLWERARVRVTIIGTVGRLEIVKDQLNLVRAFILLLEANPQFKDKAKLMLVGDGALRPQLEQLLAQANLSSTAWFVGSSDEVPDLMRVMDIFVLPSKAEGISNTILEAMATGLPVVATDVGGNSQLILDGETGRLVPKENPQALANALYEYLSQPSTIERQGQAARQRVLDCFSLDKMVSEYQKVYQNR